MTLDWLIRYAEIVIADILAIILIAALLGVIVAGTLCGHAYLELVKILEGSNNRAEGSGA